MSLRLSEEQIDDLLDNVIGTKNPNYWKDGEKLICCPVHGESNPSMGISAEKGICHCFSCSFAGDFSKLLMYSLPETFGLDNSTPERLNQTNFKAYRKASEFLALRYDLEYHVLGKRIRVIKRYEQVNNVYSKENQQRITLPLYKLAPFKSGKYTYQYFFQRGFSMSDVLEFSIGCDTDNRTVTIPVFYEDNTLAGIIGRYIDKRPKHQRYKIYDNFERGNLLYPINKVEIKDTVILVEGQFDAIRMFGYGYKNTLAIMTNSLSKQQADWLCSHCSTVIWIGDNDSRGIEGREKARELLKNKVLFKIVDYPDYGKDVCDWKKEDIDIMILNAHGVLTRKLKRYEE